MTNFHHNLPSPVKLVSNRKQYTVDFCRDKRVLHIGCVDTGRHEQTEETLQGGAFLHAQIDRVASELVGIDIDFEGCKWLKAAGYDVHCADIEYIFDLSGMSEQHERLLPKKIQRRWERFFDVDVIVIPEVLEHLKNPGQALYNLSKFNGDILISTPNAFSYIHAYVAGQGVELVHEDHNFWFSPTTLKTLLSKSGLDIIELLMYYWKQQGTEGEKLTEMLTAKPYLAEGIITIVHRKESIQ